MFCRRGNSNPVTQQDLYTAMRRDPRACDIWACFAWVGSCSEIGRISSVNLTQCFVSLYSSVQICCCPFACLWLSCKFCCRGCSGATPREPVLDFVRVFLHHNFSTVHVLIVRWCFYRTDMLMGNMNLEFETSLCFQTYLLFEMQCLKLTTIYWFLCFHSLTFEERTASSAKKYNKKPKKKNGARNLREKTVKRRRWWIGKCGKSKETRDDG